MDATITARWIRAIARKCLIDPSELTIEEAKDISEVDSTIKPLSEFINAENKT